MFKTAFVFPGQGSQTVGMLADFVPQYPIITDTFTEAADVLGFDLWQLVQNGPQEQLNQTEKTQVIMLTADIAVYRLLQQQGIPTPQMVAGHSLGEYAALVAAEALTFSDALHLVAARARCMQVAVPLGQGAMAAIIGLKDEHIQQLCATASTTQEQVTPANYNAIGQTVVAGHTKAVERAIAAADAEGALLAKIIPVSVPCHCPLLQDAAEEFAKHLAKVVFKKPIIDVVSNVDVSSYQSPEAIREKLKSQLFSPVRWVETILLFKQQGMELLVECGPGKVLGGLVKRIERSLDVISVYDPISLDQLLEHYKIQSLQKI